MQKLRIITISSTLLLGLFTLLLHKFPNCRISAQVIFFSQEMALSDHFRLNTGAQIPGVGLGKFPLSLHKRQIESILLLLTLH